MKPGVAVTITVAIACYNQANFLAEAIESVLAQRLAPDDILLIDDGSIDQTAQIAARYPGVRYHRQANAGLSAARNAALARCRTSHILFLDADDLLRPAALEKARACFEAHPGIAFAYGGYRDVTADRQPIGAHRAVAHRDAYRALLHHNHIGMHGTVLYAVAPLRAIGGFDTDLPSCEDYDVYLKLARTHPIAAYRAIAADYRRHGEGMSRNVGRMRESVRRVIARQVADGLSAEQAEAARAGQDFATRQYSLQLVGDLKRAPWRLLPILRDGLRHDPRFLARLGGAAVRLARRGWRNR